MNIPAIGAIVRKDLGEFTRNQFFVYMTVAVLIAWAVVYWFLPGSVEETVTIGIVAEGMPGTGAAIGASEAEGLGVVMYDSEEELTVAVEEGSDDVVAGLVFPADFIDAIAAGETPTVELLIPASLPDEIELLVKGLVGEAAFAIAGGPPVASPVMETKVLGVDRVGDQASLQEQMRPLLLVMVLMVETFALSALVSIEVQTRTVVAVLATPTRISDFLAAKGVFGVGLAFSEVVILGLIIGAFSSNALVVLIVLLFGAILVTGFGLIAGSYGKDFLGTLLVAMLFMIPLMIPAFGALFPGTAPMWIKMLPTYGLVEAIVGVTVDDDGLREVAPTLLLLGAWSAAAMASGAAILRRRVAML